MSRAIDYETISTDYDMCDRISVVQPAWKELTNGYKIPLITNDRLASAFINAFTSMSVDDIAIKAWDEYGAE